MWRTGLLLMLLALAACASADSDPQSNQGDTQEVDSGVPVPPADPDEVRATCPDVATLTEIVDLPWQEEPGDYLVAQLGQGTDCTFLFEDGNGYGGTLAVGIAANASTSRSLTDYMTTEQAGALMVTCADPTEAAGFRYCDEDSSSGYAALAILENRTRAAVVLYSSVIQDPAADAGAAQENNERIAERFGALLAAVSDL